MKVYTEFYSALIKGDRMKCTEIATRLLNGNTPIKEIYENVMRKALYKVGEMWELGRISVATEHLASALVESLLNEFNAKIALNKKINKKVVVACVENEFHQIGIKMVADIFELHEWDTYFLGANTPTNELIEFLEDIKPDILALSLSIYFHLPMLESMIQTISNKIPGIFILVGGQAFRHGGKEVLAKYENVLFKSDLNSIEEFIKNINKDG